MNLYVFVEGVDDERFCDKIFFPIFNKKYNAVKVIQYAGKTSKKIGNFLKSIDSMRDDYFFVTDINDKPCVTAKKQKVRETWKVTNEDKIIVIIKEIESWYLAGLDEKALSKLKISCSHLLRDTDSLSKEKFDTLIPRKFDSRIDFMLELLKNFSIQTAKQKNRSFNYFFEKHRL